MSSETDRKSEKSPISVSAWLAFIIIGVSIYELGPEVYKYCKNELIDKTCRLSPPKGHLKPMGQQYAPVLIAPELTEWPTPEVFYKEYVSAGQVVIFRGLAKTIPAFHRWTDEFLREQYGHEEVAIEVGLKQTDLTSNHLYLSVMSEFLNGYKDKEIYLVDTVSPTRFADVIIPKPIRCGNFQRAISDIIMWLSNGGTKSAIHKDGVDNLNCILQGEKKLHLFKGGENDNGNDFWMVDVDSIDLCKFPNFAEFPRYEITVKTGDCLFLPVGVYHYVASSKERNLGLNFWFRHLQWFNTTDCEIRDTENEFQFGAADMPTAAQLDHYQMIAFVDNEGPLDLTMFIKNFHYKDINKDDLTKLFNDADTNDDGVVSLQELYQVESNHFVSYFGKGTGEGYLNYTRNRGNLDSETPNDTKNVEL